MFDSIGANCLIQVYGGGGGVGICGDVHIKFI